MIRLIDAMICHAPGQPLRAEKVQLRAPRPDEVVIEIMASGLCHTDLHQIDGSSAPFPFPVIVGHEGAGIVREVGTSVTSVQPGDHAIPLTIGECGTCSNCVSGRTNLCEAFLKTLGQPQDWFSLNGETVSAYSGTGTLARFVLVKETNVAKIRKDVPFDLACLIGCAVATGVGAVTHTACVEPGQSVAVFGLGGIGLNVLQGARLAGASTIIGIDRNPLRAEQGKAFGLTHFIHAGVGEDVTARLHEIVPSGVDHSFECVGSPSLMKQALDVTRIGCGCCTILGVPPDGQTMPLEPFALQLGRSIKGSFLGNLKTRTQLPELLDLYMDGRLNLPDLISHRLSIAQANEGFDLMQKGDALRIVLTWPDTVKPTASAGG